MTTVPDSVINTNQLTGRILRLVDHATIIESLRLCISSIYHTMLHLRPYPLLCLYKLLLFTPWVLLIFDQLVFEQSST